MSGPGDKPKAGELPCYLPREGESPHSVDTLSNDPAEARQGSGMRCWRQQGSPRGGSGGRQPSCRAAAAIAAAGGSQHRRNLEGLNPAHNATLHLPAYAADRQADGQCGKQHFGGEQAGWALPGPVQANPWPSSASDPPCCALPAVQLHRSPVA